MRKCRAVGRMRNVERKCRAVGRMRKCRAVVG